MALANGAATPGIGLKRNFSWNLVGNSVYALSQWLLILVLARTTSKSEVGSFALALSIAAPVYLLCGMNLRIARATDTSYTWRMRTYLRARTMLSLVAFLVTLAIGASFGLRGDHLLGLCFVAAAKGFEASGQTYYGWMQLNGRLDFVAQSLLMRAILGTALFILGIVISGLASGAAAGLLVGWALVLFLFDRPRALSFSDDRDGQRDPGVRALLRKAWPLGVGAGLSSLIFNVPRYVVTALSGGTSSLAVYAGLSYLAQAASLVVGSLADGLISPLARAAQDGRVEHFWGTMRRLLTFSALISVVGLGFALTVGDAFVRLTLGPAYVHHGLLVALALAAGLTTMERSLVRGLQATHRYGEIAIIDAFILAVIVAGCLLLVGPFGLVGCALAVAAAMLFGCGLAYVRVRTAAPLPQELS